VIITNLIGGLGNQLFQYATGLAVARHTGAELRVAVDMFEDYRLHQGFELARVFNLDIREASASEMRDCLGPFRSKRARRLIARFLPGVWYEGHLVVQPTIRYWPGILDVGPNAYLHGYWQSERFFDAVVTELRSALSFRFPLEGENAKFAMRMQSCNSVAVHVRRGDYLSNPKNKALFADCSPKYYLDAVKLVLDSQPDAHFFIFSDDPAWAKELLVPLTANIEVIEHNRGADSYNDLRLMSLSRHIIIGNSTFSWWGAWLQEREDKIIIAPKRWLRSPRLDIDIIPQRWIRI
jgi:hypothetical protein